MIVESGEKQIPLDQVRQKELGYKTKIIEIEKELQYERNRADQYQQKFRLAIMHSSSANEQKLLQKLIQTENELNEATYQIIELKNNQMNPEAQSVFELAANNEQLVEMVEEIKNAAVVAITLKDQEIQDLNQKLNRAAVDQEIKKAHERAEEQAKTYQKQCEENLATIRDLEEKLAQEREDFLEKLDMVQQQLSNKQKVKENLVKKASNLEQGLQNRDKAIQSYQDRIEELQNTLSKDKHQSNRQLAELKIELQNCKQQLSHSSKTIQHYEQQLQQQQLKRQQLNEQMILLKEENEELDRKLAIKKRKFNSKALSSSICSSFESMSVRASQLGSFSKPREETKKTMIDNLEDVQELDELQLLENFTGFNEMEKEELDDQQGSMKKPQNSTVSDLNRQINQLSAEKNSLEEKMKINFQQISKMISKMSTLTMELQQQRQVTSELRKQAQKSQKQGQLLIELESMQQHVYKLESSLMVEKLRMAENLDYCKIIHREQKEVLTEKLAEMTEEIAKAAKKKKKGLFGKFS